MIILDTINNKIGTFQGAAAQPPATMTKATLTAVMPSGEIIDPTNTLRLFLRVSMDNGLHFHSVAASPYWTGGPNAQEPVLTYDWTGGQQPTDVQGILELKTQVIAGLDLAFA